MSQRSQVSRIVSYCKNQVWVSEWQGPLFSCLWTAKKATCYEDTQCVLNNTMYSNVFKILFIHPFSLINRLSLLRFCWLTKEANEYKERKENAKQKKFHFQISIFFSPLQLSHGPVLETGCICGVWYCRVLSCVTTIVSVIVLKPGLYMIGTQSTISRWVQNVFKGILL